MSISLGYCKINLKVNYVKYLPVEQARKNLGRLVREAAEGEPVVIGRRGIERAVLISGEEYERLRRVEEEAAQARYRRALEAIRADVAGVGLPPKVVEEAVRWVRRR